MRRHRPLSSFYAAHDDDDDDEVARGPDYSAPIGKGGGSSSYDVSGHRRGQSERNPQEKNGVVTERNGGDALGGNSGMRRSSRGGGRASQLEVSPIPSHSAHVSSFTSPPPRPFYDAPSMQHSIPALLKQLTRAPAATSLSSTSSSTVAAQSRRGDVSGACLRKPAVKKARRTASLSSAQVKKEVYTGQAAASLPRHNTFEMNGERGSTTNITEAIAARASFRVLQDRDSGPASSFAASRELMQEWRDHSTSRNTAQPGIQDPPWRTTADRAGMRYVVVQQLAAGGGGLAYTLPSARASPHDTKRLPTALPRSHAALAYATQPVDSVASTSPRRSAATHSRDNEQESAHSSSRGESIEGSDKRSSSFFYLQESGGRVGTAAEPAAAAATHRSSASDAAVLSDRYLDTASPQLREGQTREGVIRSLHALPNTAAVVTGECRSGVPSAQSSITDSAAASQVSLQQASTKSHMRHLFATVLDRSRTNFTSHTPSVSADTSALPSATECVTTPSHQPQVHQQLEAHARAVASPLVRPPVPTRRAVAGGVESRGASPASGAHTTAHLTTPMTTYKDDTMMPIAPCAEAVREGGDPLVLRHTIDYLLAKARRLEAENAALWVEGHSWNPHRHIEPQEAVSVQLVPRVPVREAKVSAKPSTATRASRAAGEPATSTRASATQTDHTHQQQRRKSTRVFVQRQLHSTDYDASHPARGGSPILSASVSPPLSTPSSPHRVPDGEGDIANEDPLCSTQCQTQQSVTLSSPSAVMEMSATVPVRRAEAAVQHEYLSRDVGTTTGAAGVMEKPPQPSSRATAATQHMAAASPPTSTPQTPVVSTRRTPNAVIGPPAPPTPNRNSAHVSADLEGEEGEEGLGATLPASTVRSHHSVETRRSMGSMTQHARATPLHASALRFGAGAPCSAHGTSSALHHHGQLHQSLRSTPDERFATGSNFTFNASFFSQGGRSASHNKQVQTASILSPAAGEASNEETLTDSNADRGITTLSTDRTAVIELHTSASYNRNTVRRLRAYCAALEGTRQQLRRRAVRSPPSLGASVTTPGVVRWAAVAAASSRSSSPGAPPAPRAPVAPTTGIPAAAASMPLSRPFFASEYADPEVDATLYDVGETPAMDTMIVLQEDGRGDVSKRIVDDSTTRASVSAGRSPSPTLHGWQQPPSRRRHEGGTPTASSLASYHGLDAEDAYAPSSSYRAHSPQPLFATAQDRPGGETRQRNREDAAAQLHSSSLRGDLHHHHHRRSGGVREMMPKVQLGRLMLSDSASSLPVFESKDIRSPDIAPLSHLSIASALGNGLVSSGRFALPRSPASAQPEELPLGASASLEIPVPSIGTNHPPAVRTVSPKAGELQQQPLGVSTPRDAATAAPSTRFAVPDSKSSDAAMRAASRGTSSSNGSSRSRSRSYKRHLHLAAAGEEIVPDAAASAAAAPPPPPPSSSASMAAPWDSKEMRVSPQVGAEVAAAVVGKSLETRSGAFLSPAPPPADTSTNISTNTAFSASSQMPLPLQTSKLHNADADGCDSLKDLASVAAVAAESTVAAGVVAPVRVSEYLTLHDGHEAHTNDPSSPAPHSPPSRQESRGTSADGGVRRNRRSTTVEFIDEAGQTGAVPQQRQLRQVVYARGVTWGLTSSSRGSDCGSGVLTAMEKEVDAVEAADEFLVAAPISIDLDLYNSGSADRVEEEIPPSSPSSHVRLISPPLPRAVAAVHTEDSQTGAEVSHPTDGSDTALSSRRRRAMPLMQRPPMAPSRATVHDDNNDISPSESLSRSLHSFSSSPSEEGDVEEDEETHHTDRF